MVLQTIITSVCSSAAILIAVIAGKHNTTSVSYGGDIMTQNQNAFRANLERERSNRAVEGETARHNVTTEGETGRHNLATESVELGKLSETTRHNVQIEGVEKGKLAETGRHNLVSEYTEQGKLGEVTRHNRSTEQIAVDDRTARFRTANYDREAQLLMNKRTNLTQTANTLTTVNQRNVQAQADRASREKVAGLNSVTNLLGGIFRG